jgi:hypothetical protein
VLYSKGWGGIRKKIKIKDAHELSDKDFGRDNKVNMLKGLGDCIRIRKKKEL